MQIGSQLGQQLIAIEDPAAQFEACIAAFNAKRVHRYRERDQIRGKPGKREGEAFPVRVTRGRDATDSKQTENLTSQEGAGGDERS